jgi:hypothetical protein
VHALLLESQSQRIGIISLDVLGIDVSLANELREAALDRFKISNMLIASTHTHSSLPAVNTCAGGLLDSNFRVVVISSVIDTLQQAELGLEKVTSIESAQNTVSNLNYNRRTYENRPVDQRVRFLRVKMASGKKVVVVRYTCHPVCFGPNNLSASSDFVGYLETMLRPEELVFLNGCAGYVDPATNLRYTGDPGARRMAIALVNAITSSNSNAVTMQDLHINSSKEPVSLTFQSIQPQNTNGVRLASSGIRLATSGPTVINTFRLGDVILVGLPGEPFTETGNNIEAACKSDVWVIGYADGYFGYLIDQTAQNQPGYEGGTAPQIIGYTIHATDTSYLESAAIAAVNKIV